MKALKFSHNFTAKLPKTTRMLEMVVGEILLYIMRLQRSLGPVHLQYFLTGRPWMVLVM
jgi:hypothetical protein